MTILKATIMLILVMDPMGNVPLFMSFLSGVEPRRARIIVVRELFVAFAVLALFLLAGEILLEMLQVSEPALSIAGGVILFLIALKMIFASVEEIFRDHPAGEPFIVPLAVPLIAGPSAMATVLLLTARHPGRWLDWLIALICACLVSGGILVFAGSFSRVLGVRGLNAMQRLMGLLLTAVAVQMFLTGIAEFIQRTLAEGGPAR